MSNMTICERVVYMMEYGSNCFDFWDFEINKRIEVDLPVKDTQRKYATVKVDGVEAICESDFFKFKKALIELQDKLYNKGEMCNV